MSFVADSPLLGDDPHPAYRGGRRFSFISVQNLGGMLVGSVPPCTTVTVPAQSASPASDRPGMHRSRMPGLPHWRLADDLDRHRCIRRQSDDQRPGISSDNGGKRVEARVGARVGAWVEAWCDARGGRPACADLVLARLGEVEFEFILRTRFEFAAPVAQCPICRHCSAAQSAWPALAFPPSSITA